MLTKDTMESFLSRQYCQLW